MISKHGLCCLLLVTMSLIVAFTISFAPACYKRYSGQNLGDHDGYLCSSIMAGETIVDDDIERAETPGADHLVVHFANKKGETSLRRWTQPRKCWCYGTREELECGDPNWQLHEWLKSRDLLLGPYVEGGGYVYLANIDAALFSEIRPFQESLILDRDLVEEIEEHLNRGWQVVYKASVTARSVEERER